MGVVTTCTCTPYLAGNVPHYGEHLAWAESSAVCYANSVIGARTRPRRRTKRPGCSPDWFHAKLWHAPLENVLRLPSLTVQVQDYPFSSSSPTAQRTAWFGALGKIVGQQLESTWWAAGSLSLSGIPGASLEELKSFCASIATFGGVALFHMDGVTPRGCPTSASSREANPTLTRLRPHSDH